MKTATYQRDLAFYRHPELVHAMFDDPAYVGRVLRLIGAQDAGRVNVLDAGCGAGAMVGRMATLRQTWRYTGLDRSAGLLADAATRYPEIVFEQADLTDPAAMARYRAQDVVTCLGHTLSYQLSDEHLDAALDGLASCLRPGGLLIIDTFQAAVASPSLTHTLVSPWGPVRLETTGQVREIGFLDVTWTWQIPGRRAVRETFRQRAIPVPDLTHRLHQRGLTLIECDHEPGDPDEPDGSAGASDPNSPSVPSSPKASGDRSEAGQGSGRDVRGDVSALLAFQLDA
ncbi:class I SAM-dependent methyltransferase [Kineosporia sp. J2-2]|uniref:Class I SAM-dependent methyltransferase n=1 Tax=Kineosporia corallincola TaxID=2835133 RepID=A0ABS5TTQ8_9ACTN|nr:class I SAM-dependent methyltransferase [Kineosporia corallincola]MBT0774198.1 class I SAM-dependent methyltransferase [Kineosporia corallincola]